MTEFVEGWSIVQTLGEGAYGEVKLLINRNTNSAVAVKMIDLNEHPSARVAVRKEVHIHQLLTHPNIIKFYGQRQDHDKVFIFLEYASGGELFNRIEPDIGTSPVEAQRYFKQLICGVEFLHQKGIAHRDLKPENLLVDDSGNLKISDFGLATFFRVDGKERLLERRCGTECYAAPEVWFGPYAAEPADIWCCGIVLVALLAGELPWTKAALQNEEYELWKTNKRECLRKTPWSKIDITAVLLIEKILLSNPKKRCTIQAIKAHRWYNQQCSLSAISMDVTDSNQPLSWLKDDESTSYYSQPEHTRTVDVNGGQMNAGLVSFSQPTQIENLLVSTQLLPSQPASNSTDCLQRYVKRMTRFFVKTSVTKSVCCLKAAVQKLGYTWKHYLNGVVTIVTGDSHGCITFKVSILSMEKNILLDFRLSKGCGLAFKRRFMAIKRELDDIIEKEPILSM